MTEAQAGPSPPTTPDHVPASLVFSYDFSGDPMFATAPVDAPEHLTRGAPDIFYSPLNGGFWVLKRFDDMREVSRRPDVFSNYPAGIPATVGRSRKMAPIEIDPPELDRYRYTLGPALAPPKVKAMEDQVRSIAGPLIAACAPDGRADFVEAVSSKLPVRMFLRLVNVDDSESEPLRILHRQLFSGATVEARIHAGVTLEKYYTDLVRQRQDNLGDDLISRYITATPEGGAFSFEDVVDATMQLFVAGLDTVTNVLSLTWDYLARHPEMQQLIRDDPSIIPSAADEMLRYTGIISSTRTLTQDFEFNGVRMKTGDRVLMPLNLANRDPEVFPDGGEVHFGRKINNHLAFGSGPHRCLGSHLAKLEMVVTLEEWFRRVPAFSLDPHDPALSHGGHAFGMDRLPLIWEAAR
ncbi:MAG: cytochrome [Caulobacter sp.]|nr:cytochrome [Caulobacter sp.]